MRVSVSDADGQLAELIRRAKAGDDVALTDRMAATEGADAARSQDFLYDEFGLPK